MIATAEQTIPGYVVGTWTIDPTHSEIGFSVRHMMVSKVRGKFTSFSGEIVTGESLLDSSIVAAIDLSSYRYREPGSGQAHSRGRLLRTRPVPDDELSFDSGSPRWRPLRARRRAHPQSCHQTDHAPT